MRNAFAQKITEIGKIDQRVILLSGDIGNRLFDDFKTAQPERFLNCGVAEQNMTGVAAGLAIGGIAHSLIQLRRFAPHVAWSKSKLMSLIMMCR